MLLIGGALHPRIQSDGPSKLIRNGVGETAGGGAAFVISETPVSFGKMARFFRDELAARDALFLDGDISQMRTGADLAKPGNQFGSIIAVIAEQPAKQAD